MASAFDRAILGELKKKMAAAKAKHLEIIVGGLDQPDYQRCCGYLHCLRDIDASIEQILTDAQKG